MSIKRKHQIQKLSSRPFSQFGAEMPATVTRNSLSAPERITSAATPWQTSPCVELQTGAHCLSWVLSELCLKFHILTLFVFIFKNYHMSCMLLTEGCAELVLPQSYRSHWTFICMLFFFFFFEELKCIIVCLSISDGLITVISMQWHFFGAH